MKSVKKQGLSFYTAAIAAVLVVVSLALAWVSNGVVGYSIMGMDTVIISSIVALVGIVLSLLVGWLSRNKAISYLGIFVAMVLCGVCAIIIIHARSELIGTLWLTALDSVNPLAVSAMNTGAPSFILYFVAMFFLFIAGCAKFIKE